MNQIDVKSVESAMQKFGNRCALPILACLLNGPRRFSDLQTQCDVCPRTLSARLDELTSEGLIRKRNSGEYQITTRGQKLQPVIEQLAAWK